MINDHLIIKIDRDNKARNLLPQPCSELCSKAHQPKPIFPKEPPPGGRWPPSGCFLLLQTCRQLNFWLEGVSGHEPSQASQARWRLLAKRAKRAPRHVAWERKVIFTLSSQFVWSCWSHASKKACSWQLKCWRVCDFLSVNKTAYNLPFNAVLQTTYFIRNRGQALHLNRVSSSNATCCKAQVVWILNDTAEEFMCFRPFPSKLGIRFNHRETMKWLPHWKLL